MGASPTGIQFTNLDGPLDGLCLAQLNVQGGLGKYRRHMKLELLKIYFFNTVTYFYQEASDIQTLVATKYQKFFKKFDV